MNPPVTPKGRQMLGMGPAPTCGDTTPALLPCPFCGRPAGIIQPVEGLGQQWNAYCTGADDPDAPPDCGVVQFGLVGQTQEEVAALWNRRWIDPDIRDFAVKFQNYTPGNLREMRLLRIAYAKIAKILKL